MLGSHIDTVVDAGKYDGELGVLAAIAAVAEHGAPRRAARPRHRGGGLRRGGGLALSDPHPHLLGADRRGEAALFEPKDGDGISVREALAAAGGDAKAYRACARRKGEIAAYLELHIEQGPVLDDKGLALAAVTAINGSVRSGRHRDAALPATPAPCRWARAAMRSRPPAR